VGLVRRVGTEGTRVEERAVQRHTEAELVARSTHQPARELLGGSVGRRGPCRHSRASARRIHPGAHHARQAEVDHPGAAVAADHDVAKLEVTVDDAGFVGRVQAAGRLAEHVQDPSQRSRFGAQPGGQIIAVHEFHGNVKLTSDSADIVDGEHIGVAEPRQRLGFLGQALALLPVGGGREMARVDQLERDAAVEARIECPVHDTHATAAQRLEYDVAIEAGATWQRRA